MLSLSARARIRRFFISPLFLLLLAIPTGFLVYAAHNAYETARETYERRMALQAELDEIEERNATLEANIAKLHDPRDIEAELRKRYDVAREGEEVVILVEEQDNNSQAATPSVEQEVPERAWWQVLRW